MATSDRVTVWLPVAAVTCLEDRAEVTRRGELQLSAGINRLRVEGLSLLAVDRSLRVEIEGAKLLDAALARRWKEVPQGGLPADASALRRRHQELEKAQVALADEQQALTRRRELLLLARADVLRDICEWTGAGKAVVTRWKERFAHLRDEAERLDALALELGARRAQHTEALASAARALALAEQPVSSSECALELNVDSTGGGARVRVSYLVPCAVWRPAYRATLAGDALALETFAVVWQQTGEAWKDVALSLSTARPTLGTQPPTLSEDWLVTRPRTEVEKKIVDVAVREEVIQTTGEDGMRTASELPGLDDGGEARLLPAPAPATIPSDGQPHRVPLSQFTARSTLEWLCIPALSPRINLVARFANQAPHVLLAGPVDLVRNGGFTGRARLGFHAPGETVVLPFGSEDGARAVREVKSHPEEARLTGRKTTTYEISTWLVNASAAPLKVTLEERVPVSEVKEVEVKLLEKGTRPAPDSVSPEGIARFSAEVPPNARRELVFKWELSASAKVAGL